MKGATFSPVDVQKIAKLANIPISEDRAADLAAGFTTTIHVVNALTKVDVAGMEPTSQVTGLENVFREDEIDESQIFSQEEALANAKRTHKGFFVVDQILEEK